MIENNDPLSGIDINEPADLWLARIVARQQEADASEDYFFSGFGPRLWIAV